MYWKTTYSPPDEAVIAKRYKGKSFNFPFVMKASLK